MYLCDIEVPICFSSIGFFDCNSTLKSPLLEAHVQAAANSVIAQSEKMAHGLDVC
jgi:hypothetical protein